MARSFDVVIIGAGPAGYVAAIRCAQLGLSTACIDDWLDPEGKPALGGTCLNAGCIPSKALLESSELYSAARERFAQHGIHCQGLDIDVSAMQSRKQRAVHQLTDGIATLFHAHKVAWLQGRGRLLDNKQVEFTPHGKPEHREEIGAEHVILAPGSRPMEMDAAPVDSDRIVDSSGALAFQEAPKRLGIIGAGVIGLELGSVWRRLGSEIVLLEAQDTFLSMADHQLAHDAFKHFNRQGLDIRLGARVVSTRKTKKQVSVYYQHGEEEHELKVDKLVVAVGRIPNSEGLAAPESNLLLDERGFVHVDEQCSTNLPGVYAIGDAVRGPMLAHKGSEEGIAVAESIASGRPVSVNYDTIPAVIYTMPEIAWVGRSEHDLRNAGTSVRVGTFPFAASGRARAMDESPQGMVKMIADAESDRILGVHIIGPQASELIAETVLAMEFAASSEDLARTIHAHPTLSEAVHEAALAVDGRAIHMAARAAARRG
ncbi:MAG: dihydrolipoyl dehydrogenase [Gammaproteobacteria bacterium]|nr:dihydrolipoyl dehydrogenase [Gammaproteobacteria bacterium]NIR97096.1 dihydrolipoyl dehydrogenase [Gammaproteobacteria bacterium]NIT62799.1 dihydrolipoyl dehydrogenase [Gammaproteobacteria bacterium]NIV19764.1 dihydrolipoyl dehydrogenase [Gammaproteobacteria bacterium]NIX11208.1 dihydrolipoyl dehydrogenase [Gammaproteobacteria bacterium]